MERKVLQVGLQYRKITSIYSINTTCSRDWFPGVADFPGPDDFWLNRLKDALLKEAIYRCAHNGMGTPCTKITNETMTELHAFGHGLVQGDDGVWQAGRSATEPHRVLVSRVDNEHYDFALRSTVLLVPLWSASANNAVLEAIASLTPIFVTRLSATEEYLGPQYPMFFNSEEEVPWILCSLPFFLQPHVSSRQPCFQPAATCPTCTCVSNLHPFFVSQVSALLEDTPALLDLMNRTHQYLRQMPKGHLLMDHFQHAFRQSVRGRRWPCAEEQYDTGVRCLSPLPHI